MLNFDEIVRALDEEIVAEAVDNPSAVADLPETGTGTEPETEQVTEVAPAVSPQGSSRFLDMLITENEAYRNQQKAEWDRREKEAKSRKTWAALADAVSSLGNLVGTTAGASNQPQTYQMPFVNQDVEQDRAYARTIADRIRANDQALRSREAGYADPLALENLRHQNTMSQIAARGAIQSALEEQKQKGRETLKDMYYKYRGDYDKMMADLKRQGIKIQRDKLDEAIRHNMAIEELREQYGGGNVGGYTTETTINRNEYGQETGRTTTRTPAPRPGVNDQTTTTTTTKTPSSTTSETKPASEKKGGFRTGEKKEKKEKKGGFKTK